MSIKKVKIGGLTAVFLIFTVAPKAIADRSAQAPAAERTVRINILSKSIRLLSEGELEKLRLVFPAGTHLKDPHGRTGPPLSEVSLKHSPEGWSLITDAGIFKKSFSLVMDTPGPNRSFEAQIGNERRRYPLPLSIRSEGGKLELIVTEKLAAYSLDAALAEYGPLPPNSEEALYALALLIAARLDGQGRPHNGYDVCDLAHCVVYRGRTGPPLDHIPISRIDSTSLPCGAHFHANCGGRTLGERVFGHAGASCTGVRDRLVETGTPLCRPAGWKAVIGAEELMDILSPDIEPKQHALTVFKDEDTLRVNAHFGRNLKSFSAEDFRLRVNRVKGWNFLKSNDYSIEDSVREGKELLVFTGNGNGHGAGLCQSGAVKLARRGFSRHEILYHYYPSVRFLRDEGKIWAAPPEASYVLFDPATGEITGSSHPAFEYRELPAGSIFKLLVALYCAVERPDLFDSYTYNCSGRAQKPLPDRCWTPEGHGRTGMERALSNSCNLYFASLHAKIDKNAFYRFCSSLESSGLFIKLASVSGPEEFGRLLAGLDYRARWTVRDIIALARIIHPGARNLAHLRLSGERQDIISRALCDTMISGTVGNSTGRAHNGLLTSSWGKTATVLSGSNRLTGYGFFLGGTGNRAVFTALKDSTGARAGRLALKILGQTNAELIEKN